MENQKELFHIQPELTVSTKKSVCCGGVSEIGIACLKRKKS